MACTMGCKFVGLLLMGAIGLFILYELWENFKDYNGFLFEDWLLEFVINAIMLIFLPFVVFALFYQIHFMMLTHYGPGASFMSMGFQQSLLGSKIPSTFKDVSYGSKIFMRHHGSSAGYFHSHKDRYPAGTKTQQVTLYGYRDPNSEFLIKRADNNDVHFEKLRNGDLIRLEHLFTGCLIFTSDTSAPVSVSEKEVGCEQSTTPGSDVWKLEIVDKKYNRVEDSYESTLGAAETLFRLYNPQRNCYLSSMGKKLPKWGFEQFEVTCSSIQKPAESVWRVDVNVHPELGSNAEKVTYPEHGFLYKFVELNSVMLNINNGLTSSHPFDSR
jgi:dolichyl-phosphate-mannose-protein mannosyltransferase